MTMMMEEDGDGDGGGGEGWSNVTVEILVEIFRRLGFEERYAVIPFVCKAWLRAAMEPACWDSANMEGCFRNRQESSDWWTASFERKMDSMIKAVVDRSHGRLLELRTRHCSDDAVFYASSRCPLLQYLSLRDSSGITDLSISNIASFCPNLRYMDITECRRVSALSLKNLGQNCKSLTVLKRNMQPRDEYHVCRRRSKIPKSYVQVGPSSNGDEEAIVLGMFMPNLTRLELKFSTLSDIGLASIINGCTKLSQLDLYGCTHVSQGCLQHASDCLQDLQKFVKPTPGIMSISRYGHWQLYDERFRNNSFQF